MTKLLNRLISILTFFVANANEPVVIDDVKHGEIALYKEQGVPTLGKLYLNQYDAKTLLEDEIPLILDRRYNGLFLISDTPLSISLLKTIRHHYPGILLYASPKHQIAESYLDGFVVER